MRKILIIIIITFGFNISIIANETKCKVYDLKCKSNKIWEETKNFKKKGNENAKKQLGNTKKKIIELPSKIK